MYKTLQINKHGRPSKMVRTKLETRAIRLPMVNLHGIDYVVDLRLREFREINQPICFIRFNSETGRRMLDECLMEVCPHCGRVSVVSVHSEETGVECGKCNSIVPIPELKWLKDEL